MADMIHTFEELPPEQWPSAGGKGGTLARLYQAGYPVPNGLIVLPPAFDGDEMLPQAWAQVLAHLACLRGDDLQAAFAVRSSALAEDSAKASFAGEFETVLDVRTDEAVRSAIQTVRRSRHSERARAYSQARGLDTACLNGGHEMAVVVQRLVQADISGVLFTADPVTGSHNHMIGNYVHGLGERLVSGEATPHEFTLSRPRGRYEGPPELRRFARRLYKLATRLERELGSICRKVTTKVVEAARPEVPAEPSVLGPEDEGLGEGPAEGPRPEPAEGQEGVKTLISEETVAKFLGKPKYFFEAAERTETPGVATGLAWMPTGGDILFIEATRMPGKKGFTLTGQLGDVMKESAQAALSYVRSKVKELGIDEDFFEENDIHLHVPAGSIPKDGPSAGVTMATALASLLLDRPVRSNLGMTGEITLRGQVLPVGGIKEKILAAHRVGLKTVILPQRNEPDLDDVPEDVKEVMTFVLADQVDQVFRAALADQ